MQAVLLEGIHACPFLSRVVGIGRCCCTVQNYFP